MDHEREKQLHLPRFRLGEQVSDGHSEWIDLCVHVYSAAMCRKQLLSTDSNV